MIFVVIVDDQQLIRDGFKLILNLDPDFHVVGEAADGKAALELTARLRPDVVLLDIRMPVMDGLEATRRLTAAHSTAGILVLTTFDLDEYVYQALRDGARGFLLKDAPRGQLIHAVKVVAGRDSLLAPSITRRLIERFVQRPPYGLEVAGTRAGCAGRPRVQLLTAREKTVLRLLARGFSNAEIADDLVVGESTVKTHVARTLGKLGVRDRVQAVIAAYECDFVEPWVPNASGSGSTALASGP